MSLRLARPAVFAAAALAYATALLAAVWSDAMPALADSSPGASSLVSPAGPVGAGTPTATGDARYYVSSVVAVEPSAPGLTVTVADGGAVTLENRTGREVVVLGYADEPYLRFTDTGMVLRNRAALTTALVAGRTPGPTAAADGTPRVTWEHVSHDPRFTWTDVRARWAATERPPVVQQDEHARHRVFDWALNVTVGGQPTLVRGAVDWIGTPATSAEGTITWGVTGAALAVTLGALMLAVLRRRRSRRRRALATGTTGSGTGRGTTGRGTTGSAGPAGTGGTGGTTGTAGVRAPSAPQLAHSVRPARSPYLDGPSGSAPATTYESSLFTPRQHADAPYAEVLAEPAPTRRSRRSR